MLYAFSQTGGLLSLGGRRLLVKGRDIQQLAEFESLWLRVASAPLDELRLAIARREDLQNIGFTAPLFKQVRLVWLADKENQKAKLASNPEGRLFSLWQALRDNSPDITIDWVEDAVSEALEKEEHPSDFWLEVERAIAIAAGRDELGLLGGMHAPSSRTGGTSLEVFMSKLVNEGKWRPDDVKKLTNHAIKLFFSEPQDLDDKLESEARGSNTMAHLMRRNYRKAATAFLNGRRWDDTEIQDVMDEKETFTMIGPDSKSRQVMRCQICLKEKKPGDQLEHHRVEKKKKLWHQIRCKECGHGAKESQTIDGSFVWWRTRMEMLIED